MLESEVLTLVYCDASVIIYDRKTFIRYAVEVSGMSVQSFSDPQLLMSKIKKKRFCFKWPPNVIPRLRSIDIGQGVGSLA